jgi:hypothetical protein
VSILYINLYNIQDALTDPTPSIRSGLTGGDHVQGALLSLRLPASESLWRTTSPLEASTGAVPE